MSIHLGKTAKDAIITEDPRTTYENEQAKIDVDVMFSFTSSVSSIIHIVIKRIETNWYSQEYMFLLNPNQSPENSNQTFGWVDPLNANFNIDPPVQNLGNSSELNVCSF